jgi:Deacetylases, including yeast histone deacetylase and acetoin utilization protein
MIIYKHDDCLFKDNGFNHPERKERISSILESIKKITDFKIDLKDAPLADIETISLVHPKNHIEINILKYTKNRFDRSGERTIC